MALLTKKGMHELISRIWETGGLTPDMEEDIKRLKDDFDERDAILRKYGEAYDGEAIEYEFKEKEGESGWEEKYNEIKKRYVERFLGSGGTDEKEDTIIFEKADDNITDDEAASETLTIDDMLYKEG